MTKTLKDLLVSLVVNNQMAPLIVYISFLTPPHAGNFLDIYQEIKAGPVFIPVFLAVKTSQEHKHSAAEEHPDLSSFSFLVEPSLVKSCC